MMWQGEITSLHIAAEGGQPMRQRQEVNAVMGALIHRCGLFAEVLEGGIIRPGAVVKEA